uniref:hypothetical protein n=1 Tax=Yoonia sp. TaxID=2212373 RepID=UPI0040485CEF
MRTDISPVADSTFHPVLGVSGVDPRIMRSRAAKAACDAAQATYDRTGSHMHLAALRMRKTDLLAAETAVTAQ